MTLKKFNLSEKIILENDYTWCNSIDVDDVKEFIRQCEDNSEEINGRSYIRVSKMQKVQFLQ